MSKIRKPEENENGASGIQIAKLDHDFQPNAFSAHTHGDELEIIYLRQGVVSMEVDGIRFDARSGAVVVIPANALHSGTYAVSDRSGKFDRYALKLRHVQKPGLSPGRLLEDGYSPVVQLDASNILTAMFQLLEQELLVCEPGWETVCRGVLDALLTLLVRGAAPVSELAQPEGSALAADILAYLHTRYCENINLQSVADHFYISHYYLSHLMKKYLAVPMMQYVIHLRISEAQTLLLDTTYPIRQIAQMVGYPNPNYFSNVFRKITGVSPNEYRNRSRE